MLIKLESPGGLYCTIIDLYFGFIVKKGSLLIMVANKLAKPNEYGTLTMFVTGANIIVTIDYYESTGLGFYGLERIS